MITWTQSAKSELDEYLSDMHSTLRASGADPMEVTEDIRRHVDEELAASNLAVVTTEDVGRILRRISPPEAPKLRAPPPRPDHSPPPSPPGRKRLHLALLVFGVILPVLTLIVELITHTCASLLFDPVPDLWHMLLVASVPIVNLLALLVLRERRVEWCKWLGPANAFALGVAGYYALLFAPFTPFAFIGVIYLGFGLLPLSPVFSFVTAWRLRFLLRQTDEKETGRRVPGLALGLIGAVAALAFVALPIGAARYWSRQALSENPSERDSAIKWLRRIGSERTLLADCYGSTSWLTSGPYDFHLQGRPVNANDARSIYYRVTGRPFNSVPPPQLAFGSRAWSFIDEFSWDNEQGGQNVGGRLKGLSLSQSRLDGKVDADAGWSYVEWTLEFKNVFTMEREARAQIALPPGGVVSRLTLWVNGEEREAAFAGSSNVRAAYQQVVRVLRRDPVLVTMSGPDRVLMQCFPVPANGGTIKIRLGITAPVQLESVAAGWMRLPSFIERNFSISEHTEHSLWLESRQPVQAGAASLAVDRSTPGTNTLRGPLRDAELGDASTTVRFTRNPQVSAAWTIDDRATNGPVVRQSIAVRTTPRPDRIVFVVDGSRGMEEFFPSIADAVEQLPDGIEFALVLSRDGVEQLSSETHRGGRDSYREVARRLREAGAVGGQDNTRALLRGWDLASERSNSVVVWLHGPQPMVVENGETLQQRFDWRSWSGGSQMPVVLDFQTSPGPNRVLEKLNGLAAIQCVPRHGTVSEDLRRMTAIWRGEIQPLGFVREQSEAGSIPLDRRGKESSRHLARLWAFDEIQRLIAARQNAEAVELAARYQLVTPVSGAVVLESKEQFDRAGLTPVDPTSVPSVPEPGTIALLALGTGLLALRRGWKRKIRPAR